MNIWINMYSSPLSFFWIPDAKPFPFIFSSIIFVWLSMVTKILSIHSIWYFINDTYNALQQNMHKPSEDAGIPHQPGRTIQQKEKNYHYSWCKFILMAKRVLHTSSEKCIPPLLTSFKEFNPFNFLLASLVFPLLWRLQHPSL